MNRYLEETRERNELTKNEFHIFISRKIIIVYMYTQTTKRNETKQIYTNRKKFNRVHNEIVEGITTW